MNRNQGQGRFSATRQGFGFIATEADGPDLFVPADETGGALHNDVVSYLIVNDVSYRRNPEAVVQNIIKRGFKHFTGSLSGLKRRLYLVPDHPLLPPTMRVTGSRELLQVGSKVLCRLDDTSSRLTPGARVIRILGDDDDARLDIETVIAEFGLPGDYPAAALAEARLITSGQSLISPSVKSPAPGPGKAERRDFRDEIVLTIDPHDARDFDDAVSIKAESDNRWQLRVHIADVAEDIPPGSELDNEARSRGNSTYLTGRMIPMLPESLCNGSFSLSPAEDKRVLTVSMVIDQSGSVKAYRLDEAVINSRYRLNYSQVQAILSGTESASAELLETLTDMNSLARKLRERRFQRGGVDLALPAIDLQLDDEGYPAHLGRKLSDQSHQLIEEFMILANRVTCRAATLAGHPFIHRCHDSPDLQKLDSFRRDVTVLDPTVTSQDLRDIASIRRWLSKLQPNPRAWRIHSLFLQTMKRALYDHKAHGHFGLGLKWYGHFTSPIRRYSDLYNHRIIKWMIHHPSTDVPQAWLIEAAEIAESCSGQEWRSESAERTLIRLKLLRWASRQVGRSFRGTVVSVRRKGYFVELDQFPVSGFVPHEDLIGQLPYLGNSTQFGRALGDLQVGNAVIVQIARVDFRDRVIILAVRAAGKRAKETDPDALDPLIDPWKTTRTESRKGRKSRKIHRKPKTRRPGQRRRR